MTFPLLLKGSLLFTLTMAHLFGSVAVPLAGSGWVFAADPLRRGEALGWHAADPDWDGSRPHPTSNWDAVTVPHDYLSDARFEYTGAAWYRRSFSAPKSPGDQRWSLQFDSVFQRCRVWLNGQLLGTHEGGYAPFEMDATAAILPGAPNFLAIEVDNSIILRGLPGARSGSLPRHQLYPWLNYGGITGDVRLVATPAVWIANQRIVAKPELPSGVARLAVHVHLRNASAAVQEVGLEASILSSSGDRLPIQLAGRATVAPGATQVVTLTGSLPSGSFIVWDLDSPHLYASQVTVKSGAGEHVHQASFGIRSVEIAEAELRLNGRAVRLGGANRARGHPIHGGLDPDEAVAEDLALMKSAGLEFARLQHTAPGRNLLEWADRHGMLLILEVGVWGTPAEDLAAEVMRQRFRQEMREMMELAWNHPSVIGWSVGNEYDSWLPEGIEWTRDMARFVKELDPERPVTFAALGTALRRLQTDPIAEHAFDHVDLISCNIYFSLNDIAPHLDPVHLRWPGKPVVITEFGRRADQVKAEQERIDHFDTILALVRERPWICGLSYWAFNDYRSRYPGSAADGLRPWGLVDFNRKPRELYRHVANTLTPLSLTGSENNHGITATVQCRAGFPHRSVRHHRLALVDANGQALLEVSVPDLEPGAAESLQLARHPDGQAVHLIAPSGIIVAQFPLAE
jgi:beta-glucuronidase